MENKENEILESQEILETQAEEPTAPVPAEPVEEAPAPAVSAEESPAEEAPAPTAPVAEEIRTYHNAGVGRKESPFADSPYVTAWAPREPEPAPAPELDLPPVMEKKEKAPGGNLWKKIVAAVLALALVAGSCAVTASLVNAQWEDRMESLREEMNQQMIAMEQDLENQIDFAMQNGNSVSGTPNVSAEGLTPGQVYAKNVNAVVLVYTKVGDRGYSTGSGFIISADGYVITNQHVVDEGDEIVVVTHDRVEHPATLVGSDAGNDIAVLKIEGKNLPHVTLGSSDALIVGDQVAAIGNPLGELTSTLTVGYVSGKGRYVSTASYSSLSMIQTDCAINSGNSGGPLFNMKGEVVGITSAKYSGQSNSGANIEGIGFAIPMDDVMPLVEDIIEFGYVNSAYLGIEVNNQNEINPGLPHGAYVAKVTPGTCAEKAGIKAGDYIQVLDGKEVMAMTDLTRILRHLDPGTTTTVVVLRGSKTLTLEITLDARPREDQPAAPEEQIPLPEEGSYEEWYEYFRWFFENQGKENG